MKDDNPYSGTTVPPVNEGGKPFFSSLWVIVAPFPIIAAFPIIYKDYIDQIFYKYFGFSLSYAPHEIFTVISTLYAIVAQIGMALLLEMFVRRIRGTHKYRNDSPNK